MSQDLMRSAVITGERTAQVETFPIPACDDDKILVKINCCGICTFEQRVFSGVHKTQYPYIGGHEAAGTIVAIGQHVTSGEWQLGQTVVVGDTLPCQDCHPCKTGHEERCVHFDANKHLPGQPYHGTGALSEYMMVAPESVFPYYNVTPEEACLTEPLSCVVHSVETANPQFGEVCVIIGAGMMGLLHAVLSVRKGACVIITDMNEERLAFARTLGAHYTINPDREDTAERIRAITHGHMADVVFDTTPVASVVEQCFDYAAPGCRIVVYSGIYPNKPITVNPGAIHKYAYQLLGTANSNPRDFTRAAEMISYGVVDMKPFITGVYPVEEIQACLESSCTGKTYRNIVHF